MNSLSLMLIASGIVFIIVGIFAPDKGINLVYIVSALFVGYVVRHIESFGGK